MNESTEKKMDAPKMITKFVVRRCVNVVVAGAIASLVPTETKAQKAQVLVATLAISGTLNDAVGQWTERTYDETVNVLRLLRKTVQETTPAE